MEKIYIKNTGREAIWVENHCIKVTMRAELGLSENVYFNNGSLRGAEQSHDIRMYSNSKKTEILQYGIKVGGHANNFSQFLVSFNTQAQAGLVK